MPFLSRRSVDPLIPIPPLRDRGYPQRPFNLPQNPRSRARSEASLFRRVSTLFTVRRRNTNKTPLSQASASPPGIEHRCSYPWSAFPRVSSDSSPPSSLEIRRPSGLGRRASLLESRDSIPDIDSFEKVTQEDALAGAVPNLGFTASLPNLLGHSGAFHSPERVTYPSREPPRKRRTPSNFAFPDSIFRVVLEFLPRDDLAAVACVSRGFCVAARYTLYHSLDVQTISKASLEKLYHVLAHRKDLAALVVSFYCHAWPSSELAPSDGFIPCIPLDDIHRALQNMHNLKSLTLASFASILSLTPSLTFSLTHLAVLDEKISQSELVAMRSWLATQPSLESLSFPHLVECTNADPSFVDEWASVADPSQTDGHGPLSTILPNLKSLRASTEAVSTLCAAMHNPIEYLTLDVHATLYTGLRPSTVIRSLGGVRDMHIIFAPEVDKRTVEKFLGVTGSMLTGEDKAAAMKSLEVEVSWTDDDAAQVCCTVLFHSHIFADLVPCRRFTGLSPLSYHVFAGWRHSS